MGRSILSRDQKPTIEWGPSLEMLDQLCGCDERLTAMIALFANPAQARTVMEKFITRGVIEIYGLESTRRIKAYELRGLLEENWGPAPEGFMVALTDKGADAFEKGDWGLLH